MRSKIWEWTKSFIGGVFECLGSVLSAIGDALSDIDFPNFDD